jgi:hypothetical protein
MVKAALTNSQTIASARPWNQTIGLKAKRHRSPTRHKIVFGIDGALIMEPVSAQQDHGRRHGSQAH